MKAPIASLLVLAVSALFTASCAPAARMPYQPAVRAKSATSDAMFAQLMGGTGGVAFADEVVERQTKGRELVKVEPLATGNSLQSGKERWTVRHADGRLVTYLVAWERPQFEVTPEKQFKRGR